jgi:hypothetical protein
MQKTWEVDNGDTDPRPSGTLCQPFKEPGPLYRRKQTAEGTLIVSGRQLNIMIGSNVSTAPRTYPGGLSGQLRESSSRPAHQLAAWQESPLFVVTPNPMPGQRAGAPLIEPHAFPPGAPPKRFISLVCVVYHPDDDRRCTVLEKMDFSRQFLISVQNILNKSSIVHNAALLPGLR